MYAKILYDRICYNAIILLTASLLLLHPYPSPALYPLNARKEKDETKQKRSRRFQFKLELVDTCDEHTKKRD